MGFLENRDLSGVPSIPEYYRGKTIFITGGSGFMGKVLIEKLLYSCSDLKKIYILLRSKRGTSPEERLLQLYSSLCFNRLKDKKPNIFGEKVSVVSGDVAELGLGLSPEDRCLLVNEVDIIFHVAASVRFDDPLSFATKLNLRGTRELVEISKEMKNLSAFVHVSTSYSNTNTNPIKEAIYPPHADWRDTITICETTDEHSLRVLTPKYLDSIPNTYAFTKQLAETVVYEQKGQIPAVIIRPSIVISSVSEPMPGWIENFNGPVGLFVACGKGIMHSIYSDPDLIGDFLPVDVAIKNLIVAAWIRGTKKLETTDDIPFYNNCTANLNNMTMGEIVRHGLDLAKYYPLDNAIWRVNASITTSKFQHYLKVLVMHFLPALLVDAILWLIGRKPMLLKVQRRIFTATLALGYYVTHQWTFENDNFVLLRSRIKEEDKEEFFYEIEKLDKVEYFTNSLRGGRIYLLKENEEDLPKALAHSKRLEFIAIAVKTIFYGFLLWWLINTTYFQRMYSYLKSL